MDKTKFKINRKSNTLQEGLNQLSKEELIEKVVQLRAHNSQLKNIIEKANQQKIGDEANKRKFDFSQVHKRHVLLKFLYFGWDYQGFAGQEDTTATIEFHLFKALKKTCLIENRETSNYNRCGRTDKEVSAFSQVISIDLRSKFTEDEQLMNENIQKEIDYCNILNRVLPSNIKCIAWMPLRSKSFSARFDCLERTYKYFFPKGNLDIEAMRLGCTYLIGVHDFRNLCKMDVGNGVVNFIRSIKNADIHLCESEGGKNCAYSMYYLEISGKAFLWHQIRCIMAILILIGEGNEDPSVISELLNVEKNPCKPQYSLTNGIPLNLYDCKFQSPGLLKNINEKPEHGMLETADAAKEPIFEESKHIGEWVYSKDNLSRLIENMQSEWSGFNIKQTMIRGMLKDLEKIYCHQFGSNNSINFQARILQQGNKPRHYKKLLNRKRCESLENRLDYYVKKQRLIATENCKTESISRQ